MNFGCYFPPSNIYPPPAAAAPLAELTDADVTRGRDLETAETAKLAEDAGAAGGPSILVLNDLWRYVPAYFQTMDAVQPRSEAGRRLLERRRRQIERQQQQQQRKTVTSSDDAAVENQRGTLPVDQLLAYITNTAANNAAPITAATTSSCKGRRRKKQTMPDSVDGSSPADHDLPENNNETRGRNVPREVGKREIKPADSAPTDVTDGDATEDFVVVRRGRKYKVERPNNLLQLETRLQLSRDRRHKATFCDALDEFSLHGDKVVITPPPRMDDAGDFSKDAVSTASTQTISASTDMSQSLPISSQTMHSSDVSVTSIKPVDNSASTSDGLRPVRLRYTDVVKGNKPNGVTAKYFVVDLPTQSSVSHQQKEPSCTKRACDQTAKSSAITNRKDAQINIEVSTTNVHSTKSLDRDCSPSQTKHVSVGRMVQTVSCSTQTSSAEISQHPTSNNSAQAAVVNDNVSGNGNSPNPAILFLNADTAKAADSDEGPRRRSSGLSFGSLDDDTSLTSPEAASSRSVVDRRSDAATSPIKLSPQPALSATSSDQPTPGAAHCSRRMIAPLYGRISSPCSASGAPVGIVPPIMHHVNTASAHDVTDVLADDNLAREERGRCLSAASIDREGCAVVDDELADCQSLVVAVDLPLDTDQTDAEVDKLSVQRSDASRPFDLLGIQIFLYKGYEDALAETRKCSKDALEDDRQRATKYSNLALDEQLEAERHTSLDRRHQRTSIDPV